MVRSKKPTDPPRLAGIQVSILVLLDGALEAMNKQASIIFEGSFNPCSIGWCARRACALRVQPTSHQVSILVLLDGALEVKRVLDAIAAKDGFNPCSIGWCARSRHKQLIAAIDWVFQSLFYWMVRSKYSPCCHHDTTVEIVSILVLLDGALEVGLSRFPM